MRTLKQRSIGTLIVGLVGRGIWFGVSQDTHRGSTLSSPTFARIQDKLPNHPYIHRQAQLESYGTMLQETTSTASFTIQTGLFTNLNLPYHQPLSGQLDLTTQRYSSLHTPDLASFSMEGILTLEEHRMIASQRAEDIEDIGVSINVSLQGLVDTDYIYLQIKDMGYTTAPQTSSPTLQLWYVFAKHYLGKRIQFPREQVHALTWLSPVHIRQMVEKNTDKMRLYPTPSGGGWTYDASSSGLQLTAQRQSPSDNRIDVQLPKSSFTGHIANTINDQQRTINAHQTDSYGLNLSGTIDQAGSHKRTLRRDYDIDLLLPAGLQAHLEHSLTITKTTPKQLSFPQQYLQRTTIRDNLEQADADDS